MLFALKLAPHGVTLADLRYAAQACDETAAIHSFWLNDHLLAPFDPAQPVWEAWTVLAALGSSTSRVRLGIMVSPIALRPAPLLAKMAVTVDHLSGGRLELGLGFGSSARDHEWAGIPQRRSDAATMIAYCSVVHAVWSGARAAEGRHESAPRALQPELPLWIGGRGRAALEVAARLRAGWNLQSLHDKAAHALLAELQSLRDVHGVARGLATSAQTVFSDSAAMQRDCATASELGLDLLVVSVMHGSARSDVLASLGILTG